MRNWTEKRHAAETVLAVVLLTLTAACGSAPRKSLQPHSPLSQWSSPEDCTTDYATATSGLSSDKSAAPALLVDSIGTVWNCTTIPQGRYDAEVVVRWSNGLRETALDVKDIHVASGQRLIARAYQHDRGAIPASFSDVRAQPDPAHAAVESVTPGPALESKIAQAPASESVIPAPAPEPQVVEAKAPASSERGDEASTAGPAGQAPSSGAGTAYDSLHPAVKTAVTVVAVAVLAAVIIYAPHVLLQGMRGGGGQSQPRDTKPNRPRRTSPSTRPSADCCFVWIEDGLTGEVIAGKHPFRN